LRGGLVGVCSAVVATTAHTIAGGGAPHGSALAVAVLACMITGAAAGELDLESRRHRIAGIITGLVVAQALCHLTLAAAGQHHHASAALGVTPTMLAAHAAGALILGVGICAAEHLYVVCSSVLCWLRLFAAAAISPPRLTARPTRRALVPRMALLSAGLGMRAPPILLAASA
jgi:hypothetical protein